jgi:hypothetical protein
MSVRDITENSSHKIYPICVVPPEQHYESPKHLLSDIREYERSRAYLYTENPQLAPPKNKFEIVKLTRSKGFILLPTSEDYGVLYRGQSAYYGKCLPTLYRNKPKDIDLVVAQVKVAEFRLLLEQYGITKRFEQQNLNVDIVGLAQHYGLKTNVLDFTSDIEIALFFAMCDYDEATDTYKAKEKQGTYVGYVYAILSNARNNHRKDMMFNTFSDRVRAIGLQPFKRPGRQKGFSCHVGVEGLDFGYLYSFNYTKEDSEKIFEKFARGTYLWCKDEVVRYAKMIKRTNQLSSQAIALSTRIFKTSNSINNRVKLLKANNYHIISSKRQPWFNVGTPCSDEQWREINFNLTSCDVYDEYGRCCSKHRDTSHVGIEILTNYMYGCMDCPKEYNSGIALEIYGQGVYSVRYDMSHKQLKPDKSDGKIHARWKDITPIAPKTRSFDLQDFFKMKLTRVTRHL